MIRSIRLSLLLGLSIHAGACQTATTTQSAPPAAQNANVVERTADDSVPDLTGEWSARLRSIYRGTVEGLPAGEAGADIDYLRVTVQIEIQDGRLFYGHFRAGAADAPRQEVFGAIRSDHSVATYVTAEGRGLMYLNSPDEIEICGGRGDPDSMLAFCGPLRRVTK